MLCIFLQNLENLKRFLGVASVLCKKTPVFGSRRSKLDHLTVCISDRFSANNDNTRLGLWIWKWSIFVVCFFVFIFNSIGCNLPYRWRCSPDSRPSSSDASPTPRQLRPSQCPSFPPTKSIQWIHCKQVSPLCKTTKWPSTKRFDRGKESQDWPRWHREQWPFHRTG